MTLRPEEAGKCLSKPGTSEEVKSIAAQLEEIAEEFCNSYCKFPFEIKDNTELYKKCETCPIEKLFA